MHRLGGHTIERGGKVNELRALEYALDELEQEKDKSLEEHFLALRKVIEKASEIRKESLY
jgi:hypothetical protein